MIDKRTKGLVELRIQLEEGNGVLGDSGFPIITNENRFQDQDKLKNLLVYILLSNGEIVKLKEKKDNIVAITGKLDHFGLRVLTEPFLSELEIKTENELPDKNHLQQRLKLIFPQSDFTSEIS